MLSWRVVCFSIIPRSISALLAQETLKEKEFSSYQRRLVGGAEPATSSRREPV